jgi:hypothetical protein
MNILGYLIGRTYRLQTNRGPRIHGHTNDDVADQGYVSIHMHRSELGGQVEARSVHRCPG